MEKKWSSVKNIMHTAWVQCKLHIKHLFIYHGMVSTWMVCSNVIHSFDIMLACINQPIKQSIKQARRQISLLISYGGAR